MGRTKAPGTHITYTHFCAKCPNVRIAKVKRRTNLCKDCSRKYAKTTNVDKYYFDMEAWVIKCIPKIRHFKVCTECGASREVSKSLAGFGLCKDCSSSINGSLTKVEYKEPVVKKPKPRKKPKKKVKILSESAKAILREERAELRRKEEAKKEFPTLDEHTSLSMQEEFLRKRNEQV